MTQTMRPWPHHLTSASGEVHSVDDERMAVRGMSDELYAHV